MARQRMFGSDKPFMDWMRRCRELPSFSPECGFVATDVDALIHRYMTSVDSVGTRQVQALMFLEAKSRGGMPTKSQQDTWFKYHLTRRDVQLGESKVFNFGVSYLLMSNETPEDSRHLKWCRFSADGSLRQVEIEKQTLIKLMRFELHPDTLVPRPFRRHHKTYEIEEEIKCDLGFTVMKPVMKRS